MLKTREAFKIITMVGIEFYFRTELHSMIVGLLNDWVIIFAPKSSIYVVNFYFIHLKAFFVKISELSSI